MHTHTVGLWRSEISEAVYRTGETARLNVDLCQLYINQSTFSHSSQLELNNSWALFLSSQKVHLVHVKAATNPQTFTTFWFSLCIVHLFVSIPSLSVLHLYNSFIYFHNLFFSFTQYSIKHLRDVLDTGKRRLLSLWCKAWGKRLWSSAFPPALHPCLTEASWGKDRSDGSNAGQMQMCNSRGIFSLSMGSPHIHRILLDLF